MGPWDAPPYANSPSQGLKEPPIKIAVKEGAASIKGEHPRFGAPCSGTKEHSMLRGVGTDSTVRKTQTGRGLGFRV